jgi:diacylglycerol kinase (ATP)
MSIAVLFNTFSGHRSKRWNQKTLATLQRSINEPIVPYHLSNLDDLQNSLDSILATDQKTLIISGGDGTLNRTINALLNHPNYRPIQLALLPNGTGNSFALDLNIKTLADAIQAIQNGRLQPTDVGLISTATESRYFVNNFGIGLVYDITKMASKLRFMGAFSYVVSTLVNLIKLPNLRLTMNVDGKPIRKDVLFLDICNSQFTGGDMRMAPNVALNDGRFQMISLAVLSRRLLVKTFPKLFTGSHIDETFVDAQFVQKVEIESDTPCACILDGDLAYALPLTVEMANEKLLFLIND